MPPGGRQEGLATQLIVQPGEDIAKQLGNIATLPQRAGEAAQQYGATGEYNPAPFVEAAGTGMTGGMPMAVKGAAGIFGGKLAQTADRGALTRAQGMAAKGAGRDQIWSDTGWFQGPDKQWRFEIPDQTSTMRGTGTASEIAARQGGFVGDTLYHPELYKAYPKTAQQQFAGREGLSSTYEPNPGRVTITNQMPSGTRSATLHELQHAIQEKENFARGGYADQTSSGPAYEQYRRMAGEVEARNVQRRANMSDFERRYKPPWQTQDVPYEQQLVQQAPRRWWQR
jgi:hypothetical protein